MHGTVNTQSVVEECDGEGRHNLRYQKQLLATRKPDNRRTRFQKYRYFSEPSMKKTHEAFHDAQHGPLSEPRPPWEDNFLGPDHKATMRSDMPFWRSYSGPRTQLSSSLSDTALSAAPSSVSVAALAAGPGPFGRARETFEATMERIGDIVDENPAAVQSGSQWSKYHFFNGGCQLTRQFLKRSRDDKWSFMDKTIEPNPPFVDAHKLPDKDFSKKGEVKRWGRTINLAGQIQTRS